MGYRERFTASQDKAHNQSIATKIDREMRIIRSQAETSSTAPRRWVWELMQNAKDVHINGKVSIQVQFCPINSNQKVVFSHTGKPFSADNIRFLIEQISTKDRSTDEHGLRKETGRFGTGFLSTHLLSETVYISSVAKEPDLEYKAFSLKLDRSGTHLSDIVDSVNEAKRSVENLDQLPPLNQYVVGSYYTSFTYPLIDQLSLEIAQKGINDLKKCISYTLIFCPEIDQLTLIPENILYKKTNITSTAINKLMFNEIRIKQGNNSEYRLFIATLTEGYTSIAVPISFQNGQVSLESLPVEMPKIFCDFPLVGTEVFPFPVIINNPNLNPTDPRDGVFLTGEARISREVQENRDILNQAVQLYFEILNYAITNSWLNLHLLANVRQISDNINWVSNEWFKENILNPIRSKLLYSPIVKTAANDGILRSILNSDGSNYIWFPVAPKSELRQEIWRLASHWFPNLIPVQNEIELWFKLIWNDCGKLTFEKFSEFVESWGNIDKLNQNLKGVDCVTWLNEFYILLSKDEKEYNSIIRNKAIFPNQNGDFCKLETLNRDLGDTHEELKDILNLLGKDIRSTLLDNSICIQLPTERACGHIDIVKSISSEVAQNHHQKDVNQSYKEAFKKLLLWFKNNPDVAARDFPDLYMRKYLLYDEDTIIENMDKAEVLDGLLTEFQVTSIEELKNKINIVNNSNSSMNLLPITQEIITSMGITSLDEWYKALEDKDLATLFSHESTPTTDMFIYAQSLIKKANKNIINYLQTIGDYDLTYVEEIAPTVFSGIKKNGIDISIVCRPGYNGQVIVYYGAEKDQLDYSLAELWVDDGQSQRLITLGHILKSAQIRKFPI